MTGLFKNKYRIPSARLQSWNYADNGMYFITICTAHRKCFFGDIIPYDSTGASAACIPSVQPENKMQLTDLGKIVESEWLYTPGLRSDMNLELAEYVVMPNHFHAIIFIGDNEYNKRGDSGGAIYSRNAIHNRNAMHCVSTNKFVPQSKNLASIIRGFKSAVTTFARKNNIEFNWQTRFYDHIITTNDEYTRIADYIVNNPANWQQDKFYNSP